MTSAGKTCVACKFYHAIDGETGRCKRFPPNSKSTYIGWQGIVITVSEWPIVGFDEVVCGEFGK